MKHRAITVLLTSLSLAAVLACAPPRVSSEVPSVPVGPNYLSPRDTMVPLYTDWQNPAWATLDVRIQHNQAVSSYYLVKATERCAEALERIALVLEKQQGGGTEK